MSFIFSGSKMRVRKNSSSGRPDALSTTAAEDVGVVAVDVPLAGLGVDRQRREPLDRRADRLVLVGEVPASSSPAAFHCAAAGPAAVPDARGVRQQVADRDLALRGDDRDRAPGRGAGGRRHRHRRLLEARG